MTIPIEVDSDCSERLAELGEILATGLMRLQARKSSGFSDQIGELSLHYAADQSTHVETCSEMVSA